MVVTGSNGLLGQKMIKLLLRKDGVEIHAFSRGVNRIDQKEGYTYYSIDLSDRSVLQSLLLSIRPDYVIHTAAMTNVDACELDRETCDRMNVEVVDNLIEVSKKIEFHLIHLSTDFVFSGLKGAFYTESDPADPVNYYGESKLNSEKRIQESEISFTILRTVMVYGLVDGNDRSNIVLWVKNSLEAGKNINVVTDQLRMPTYAEDLAEACWLAIEHEAKGVFNVSSSELMSIYDIALEVADTFGLDKKLIHPVKTSDLELPAKRPASTGLDLSKSVSQLKLPLNTFGDRLQVFKNQLDSISPACE